MTHYQIRRATPGDLRAVMDLIAASARWMHARGNTAWPRDGFPADRIAPRIDEGTVWLALRDGVPVATLTLDQWADPEFQAAQLDPARAKALVVHKLAVLRPDPHQPPGWCQLPAPPRTLGRELLDWAADQAARGGHQWVWLNVARDAHRLQDYYAECGFEHMTTITLDGRKSGSLWRRPAALAVTPQAG